MSRSLCLLSSRKWNEYFPLQPVYEWEDIIVKELGISMDLESQIVVNSEMGRFGRHTAQRIIRNSFLKDSIDSSFNYFSKSSFDFILSFFLYPLPIANHYIYGPKFIPILLDCFENVIDRVPEYFKRNKLLFVTNIEVYDFLQKTKIADKVRYVPLSISDAYFTEQLPLKKIDVLQIGRQNKVLHEWMMKLTSIQPSIEYVFAKFESGQHQYYSTQRGRIGVVPTRSDFMSFLGSARVILLSSPGMDEGAVRTGGFNPVTPRFYEAAVKYCHMIARYPKGAADFVENEIDSVALQPGTFDEFKHMVESSLSKPFDRFTAYNDFLRKHLASMVALKIKQEIKTL